MQGQSHDFEVIADGAGVGMAAPAGWFPLSSRACLILVGLTGVGKSTVLAELIDALPSASVLPDRRTLTDVLMIPYVQRVDGLPTQRVNDRSERFALTRRYRQLFPGGMAHALGTLWLQSHTTGEVVIFDGLRGANEVRYAAELMPQARFLMLDAPDIVRLQRLVARKDAFDQVGAPLRDGSGGEDVSTSQLTAVPELGEVLDADGIREAERWVRGGEVSIDDLAAKARIVLAERANYDPDATREALEASAPDRTLTVDTAALSPTQIAQSVVHWFEV